jgi:crotonobetainyl-CoA:carnitine CoA-transferase CaiB-like acyl-CoA transferase
VRELPEVTTAPRLQQWECARDIEHPELGLMTIFTSPIRLNGQRSEPKSYSPSLGADNEEFYASDRDF